MGIDKFNGYKNINPWTRISNTVEKYDLLKQYYDNNNLYDDLEYFAALNGSYLEHMKPIKNPAHRSCDFFGSKLMPGKSIQVNTKNQSVKDAILQFHKWSNLDNIKNVLSRNFALYGDVFLKVVSSNDKVWLESIDPKYVKSFDADKRGNLTSIRIDIPQIDENGQSYTYVEYWNKQDGYMAIWESRFPNDRLDSLGEPKYYATLYELSNDNFIPIVHAKFADSGELRGKACFEHCISKIDELNRQSTRLHEIIFRNNQDTFVASNTLTDKNGKPVINSLSENNKEIELKENGILMLPSGYSISTLAHSANYDSHLAVIQNQIIECEKDLPELRYFSLEGNLSGKAIRTLLSSAIDRANDAQASLIYALIKCDEIALTIGQFIGIFSGLGTYENNEFSHSLGVEDMFPLDLDERAVTLNGFIGAGMALKSALRLVKFTDEEIEQIVLESTEATNNNVNSLITTFNQ